MPDPGSDQSDTTLPSRRDPLAARLGVAPGAIDPGQRLHLYGLTSLSRGTADPRRVGPGGRPWLCFRRFPGATRRQIREDDRAGAGHNRVFDAVPKRRTSLILVDARSRNETLPPEFYYDFAGLSRQMRQADARVGLVFLPALVIVHLFLAAQFESFDDPVIVLITVPFPIGAALPKLSVVPLVCSSISGRTRTTLSEPPGPHPRAASSGCLVAVPGE
jgi:hypothetical protein